MEQVKIGIIGAGNIATTLAKTMQQMDSVTPYAVAARDGARAEAFAQQLGIEKAYGSYEALVQDPQVDLVYIATPHSHHAQHALLCLRNGKPILVEKAFTANATQAREVLDCAKENKLLVAEAIWPRYQPARGLIRSLVESGAIGTPGMLSASLGNPIAHWERMSQPELAGGALLDLSVYPITFACMNFEGPIERFAAEAVFTPTGVDGMDSLTLQFSGGRMAILYTSMLQALSGSGTIHGDKGRLVVDRTMNPRHIQVLDMDDKLVSVHEAPPQISGYEYEIEACVLALREGRTECPEMPHSETLRVMQLMDDIRAGWDYRFPFEA